MFIFQVLLKDMKRRNREIRRKRKREEKEGKKERREDETIMYIWREIRERSV